MTARFWSSVSTCVAAPGEKVRCELTVFDAEGRPLGQVPIEVRTNDAALRVLPSVYVTDESGRIEVELEAVAGPARGGWSANFGASSWQGVVIVSDVHVQLPGGFQLSNADESLLRMLYWNREQVRVVRQFGGGLSGCRVLQVEAISNGVPEITQVVKLGPKDSIEREGANYRLFEGRLPNAAAVCGADQSGLAGAIIYGDASAACNLAPVVPLGTFFARQSPERIEAALTAVLDRGLRRVYRYHVVRPHTIRSLIGKHFPENLVLSLSGADTLWVQQAGTTPLPVGIPVVGANQLERDECKFKTGDRVALSNVPISKMQPEDLNLEDDQQRRYKVKVRFDGAPLPQVATGDRVDVVGRFLTDRQERMQFVVEHCLQRFGGVLQDGNWLLSNEHFPNPLPLLRSILDARCDVAWSTVHGDLHWDNIMLESPENWFLIDYGLSSEGPVLFDFVKLELYLRYTVLGGVAEFSASETLAFEHSLIDNPLGEVADEPELPVSCRKAASAIRCIRRHAQRYFVDGIFDYWKLLFGYALALCKYYPAADAWQDDSADQRRLDQRSRETFGILAVALHVGRLLAWEQARAKRPALKFRFVGPGSTLMPEVGALALDTGSTCQPGVIDHHFADDQQARELECATSLVLARPALFLDHLRGMAAGDVMWTLHEMPDFDCVAAAYLAWHRLALGFFPPGSGRIAEYARQVDAGASFLDQSLAPERTPYGLFQMHLREVDRLQLAPHDADARRMQHGFEVLDCLCRLESEGKHPFATNLVPHEQDFWNATGNDRQLFETQDYDLHKCFQAKVLIDGKPVNVQGLMLERPTALLFKSWARRAGYPLLVVRWPQQPEHRVIISVPPALRGGLHGLGKALEAAETAKRGETKRRPGPPRWPDVDNADPWYDGRSPLHGFTIVDAPRGGTVLTIEEIFKVLTKTKWQTARAEV